MLWRRINERDKESTNEKVKGKGEVNGIGDKNIIANGGEGLIEKRVVGIVGIDISVTYTVTNQPVDRYKSWSSRCGCPLTVFCIHTFPHHLNAPHL